jgi:hypothetical protein
MILSMWIGGTRAKLAGLALGQSALRHALVRMRTTSYFWIGRADISLTNLKVF